jgi:hypothetical protein
MKHIIASLLFLITTTVFADPAPFGLEIGKANIADAEKMYSIEKSGNAEYHKGVVYKVAVNQVDFEGLKELTLVFNENDILSVVIATLPKTQFKSLHQSLSKKYKVVRQEIPFVGDSYTEYVNGSTNISLDAPHLSFDMSMIYMNKEMSAEVAAKLKAETDAKKKSQEDKL